MVDCKEPWITEDYKRNSFYLRNDGNEALQLIVGRSSVQIWHQFNSDPDDKDNPHNEGEPFLKYIWTNGIPVDQKNQENGLQIKEVKFGPDYFHLEIYWYEKEKVIKEKTIKWRDINENVNGVKYACKALAHLSKRENFLTNYFRKHCVS